MLVRFDVEINQELDHSSFKWGSFGFILGVTVWHKSDIRQSHDALDNKVFDSLSSSISHNPAFSLFDSAIAVSKLEFPDSKLTGSEGSGFTYAQIVEHSASLYCFHVLD